MKIPVLPLDPSSFELNMSNETVKTALAVPLGPVTFFPVSLLSTLVPVLDSVRAGFERVRSRSLSESAQSRAASPQNIPGSVVARKRSNRLTFCLTVSKSELTFFAPLFSCPIFRNIYDK